ncbi:hypothetical protein QA802_19595 [Streptomyces sp. B21-105]|uniref:hypothetical protein n=1 Tax=Streptomyces sp. B21-105 TaxID=3039417 RepID=UPI002FEF4C47
MTAASREVLGLALGTPAQARLGPAGVVLLLMLGVGLRARHSGLAVTAAVALVVLASQA